MKKSVRIGELERQVFDLRMALRRVGSELRVLRGRLDRLERGAPGLGPDWRPDYRPGRGFPIVGRPFAWWGVVPPENVSEQGSSASTSVVDVPFVEAQRAFVRGAWGVAGEGPSAASVSSGGVLPGLEVERQRQVAQAPLVDAMKPFPKPKVWS